MNFPPFGRAAGLRPACGLRPRDLLRRAALAGPPGLLPGLRPGASWLTPAGLPGPV
eukprot:NODE_2170_length_1184_cov_5.718062_g1800_i0.p4 GENE.NODE_2170_length_1184_cov_5.718062_g1800_i0~~NODE_2170_length_1184_cov_5.718062_g1800_i0.p4  ORF type:complete len:56 (+),score=3.99 NODE_2170_length_1184_cov_5.718062_g1800_i0:542-709(+)